jgi:hypothetical protein
MYYCVVAWNSRTQRADGYYGCSTSKASANQLRKRMEARGRKRIRVVSRKSRPRGVESMRAAMARWR